VRETDLGPQLWKNNWITLTEIDKVSEPIKADDFMR
jgi:hypothetical protein